MLIDRPKPIVEQITSLLRDRIHQGEYDKTGRLPSEYVLSEMIGVSRSTVRTALTILASEGLIFRKQGDGTYINKRTIEVMSHTRWEFTRLIQNSGRKPSIKVLKIETRPAAQFEVPILEIKLNDRVLAIERIFTADGIPVIYSINVLQEALIKYPYSVEAWNNNILDFLDRYCGQRYAFNIVDISAEACETDVATNLGLPNGAPILKLREVYFNQKNYPIFYGTNYFNDRLIRMRFAQISS